MRCTGTLLLVWPAALAFGQQYDLLLKGGHVIDLANNIDGIRDVAIAGGRIARVATSIPASEARRTVDVQRFYVTTGLIDLLRMCISRDERRQWLRTMQCCHTARRRSSTLESPAGRISTTSRRRSSIALKFGSSRCSTLSAAA